MITARLFYLHRFQSANVIASCSRRNRELWILPPPQVSSPESVGYYTETIGGQATRSCVPYGTIRRIRGGGAGEGSLLYLVNLPFLIRVPHCHLFLFFLSPFFFGRYISPLIVSLVSLTVPLLAVVEGLMLGVVSPPGFLFGVGACLILIGAATASMVTMLPHTEVFDATEAVKMANDGDETAGVDKR